MQIGMFNTILSLEVKSSEGVGTNLTLRSIVGVVGTRSNAGAEVDGVGSEDEVETSFEALISS